VKKLCFLFIYLFKVTAAYASVGIELKFSNSVINQGAIEKAEVLFDKEALAKIDVNNLKGKSFNDVLHFVEIAVPVKTASDERLKSDSAVVFIGIPEKNELTTKIGNQEVIIKWSDLSIVPIKPDKNFLFGNFEVPTSKSWNKFIFFTLFLIVGSLVAFSIYKKKMIKRKAMLRKRKFKNDLLAARKYEDVVEIWKKKHELIEIFPQISPPLKDLEKILFRHQFKSQQTDGEKAEVMKAYNEFSEKIRGVLGGI
jgi:hypothetical protein